MSRFSAFCIKPAFPGAVIIIISLFTKGAVGPPYEHLKTKTLNVQNQASHDSSNQHEVQTGLNTKTYVLLLVFVPFSVSP